MGCAPNLLITFINMMLMKAADHDEELINCVSDGIPTDLYMYRGQETFQKILVIVAVLMIPVMLFGNPVYTLITRRRRNASYVEIRDELLESEEGGEGEEEGFGELMIIQGIHTIEYVLGSVSHTASYLRLWALSLAHSQLSEVLWSMVMRIPLGMRGYTGAIIMYFLFAAWAALTISILVLMEGLSAFLHTL